jgi:ligand-binding sensor domain-containing protein
MRFGILLLPFLLLSACEAEERPGVPEASLRIAAADMRPSGQDPFGTEPPRNTISQVVRRVFQDHRGHMWFGSQNGLSRHDGNELVYYDLRNEYDEGIVVRSLAEDRAGNLWIGSSAGVIRFDGERFLPYGRDQGLDCLDVWRVFLDASGTVWAGTLEGAFRLEGDRFTHFPLPVTGDRDPDRGVSDARMVRAITQDRAGDLWFAAEGAVYRYDGNGLTRVPVLAEDSYPGVNDILEGQDGTLWFATHYRGLLRRDGDVVTSVTETHGLGGTEVWSVSEDRAGNLWFPAEGFGIYRYDGETFTRFSEAQGLGSGAPHAVFEDRDGRVWFFGWGGVWRLDGDTVVEVTRDGPW